MAPCCSSDSLIASPKVDLLLRRLHAVADAQEHSLSQKLFDLWRRIVHRATYSSWPAATGDAFMRRRFASLEAAKCQLLYLIAKSIGARNVVEAGSGVGVATIYLALAVGQNVADLAQARRKEGGSEAEVEVDGKVIATEKEPAKAEMARAFWREAGEEVEPWVELREGDLLETLREEDGMPEVIDLVLLDVWTPMALPTLKIIRPRLRHGAIVITDNTSKSKDYYREFLSYLHDESNGFKTVTIPYSGGLELSVYLPEY